MMSRNPERADYNLFLSQFGFTEVDMLAVTHLGTVRSMGLLGLEVRASEMQGNGLFATERILGGSVIAPALLAGENTEAGRFANHSGTPNAKMVVRDEENVDLIAIREINEEEITTDYRETLRERARLFGVGSG